MDEDALAEMLESPWLVAGVAFVLGLFTGWITWGGPWRDKFEAANGESVKIGGEIDAARAVRLSESATPDEKLAVILAEIQKAKELLAGAEEAEAAMGAELDGLDQAVKRANGRLKLILKSADRAKDSD